ncbi:MAG: DUF1656 domain-containing protein [Sphingomonadales bacterium]|nr:DUF1656 domain-containing protein [Sphingomonadales bacterium]
MNWELAIGGVYLAALPVSALVALAATLALHRLLVLVGAYRWVWHPALFDVALFVCVWAALIASPFSLLTGSHRS